MKFEAEGNILNGSAANIRWAFMSLQYCQSKSWLKSVLSIPYI